MKYLYARFIASLIMMFSFSFIGHTQQPISNIDFEVYRVYPSFSFTKMELEDVTNIEDLNPHYKSTWVKEFHSVDITAQHDGEMVTVSTASDQLNAAQKSLLLEADDLSSFKVEIHYMPDNTLSHNDPKYFSFEGVIDADQDATFQGGKDKLHSYMKNTVLDKIQQKEFEGQNLAVVTFSVQDNGSIHNVKLAESSEHESIDDLLVDAICNMNDWLPASTTSGTKVSQDFALTFGNLKSCKMNFYNTRGLKAE